MAVFCLAENLNDLKNRLGRIQVATDIVDRPIFASDIPFGWDFQATSYKLRDLLGDDIELERIATKFGRGPSRRRRGS